MERKSTSTARTVAPLPESNSESGTKESAIAAVSGDPRSMVDNSGSNNIKLTSKNKRKGVRPWSHEPDTDGSAVMPNLQNTSVLALDHRATSLIVSDDDHNTVNVDPSELLQVHGPGGLTETRHDTSDSIPSDSTVNHVGDSSTRRSGHAKKPNPRYL